MALHSWAAAFCAGMGVGAFRDWHEIDRFVTVDEVIEPRPDETYKQGYRRYRALYPALREVFA